MKFNCRLEGQDGRLDPRGYWKFGRDYFLANVFQEQALGDTCPFAGPNFQLMRNFLFAAIEAGPECSFGVLLIAPEKTNNMLRQQVNAFRSEVLKPDFRARVGLASYDELADLLSRSPHAESKALGEFLHLQIDLISPLRESNPMAEKRSLKPANPVRSQKVDTSDRLSRRLKREKPKNEVIVEIGAEGGSITLLGVRSPRGWFYSMSVDDWTPELFGEERIYHDSNVVDSWDGALGLLDRYPWHLLSPLLVHPEFRQQILAAVQKRFEASDDPMSRMEGWRELCEGTNVPAQSTTG